MNRLYNTLQPRPNYNWFTKWLQGGYWFIVIDYESLLDNTRKYD